MESTKQQYESLAQSANERLSNLSQALLGAGVRPGPNGEAEEAQENGVRVLRLKGVVGADPEDKRDVLITALQVYTPADRTEMQTLCVGVGGVLAA